MSKVMLYKSGPSKTKVWGREMLTKVVNEHEVSNYLTDGWVDHPHKVTSVEAATVDEEADPVDKGEISDGFHTFNELYAHRVRLFSTLMRAFAENAWWSFCHSDGEQYEGWILAGIDTPAGTVTYHLPESEIEYLPVGTEIEFGKEWDGHTANDVLERLISLTPQRFILPQPAAPKSDDKQEGEVDGDKPVELVVTEEKPTKAKK